MKPAWVTTHNIERAEKGRPPLGAAQKGATQKGAKLPFGGKYYVPEILLLNSIIQNIKFKHN